MARHNTPTRAPVIAGELARAKGLSYFAPESEAAEERASETGEDTGCRNCWHMFSEHTNSVCPTR